VRFVGFFELICQPLSHLNPLNPTREPFDEAMAPNLASRIISQGILNHVDQRPATNVISLIASTTGESVDVHLTWEDHNIGFLLLLSLLAFLFDPVELSGHANLYL
jgi:hypothetical protein